MDVILVDERDRELGIIEKHYVHKLGHMHRAFSIFIFNSKGELLLQKRTNNKYHSGGLWSNTCCSHPRPDKKLTAEAELRLLHEMGVSVKLRPTFSFIYRYEFNEQLIEHEFDHVFFGKYNKNPKINKNEASEYKWISLDELKKKIKKNPDKYTIWLVKIINRIIDEYKYYKN